MRELFQLYFNIAFLMGKPQDLPGGTLQMRVGVAIALLTYVMALAAPYGILRAFIQAVLDLGVTAFTLWAALMLVDRRARFEQAFGGLCGASAFINLAAIPLYTLRPVATSAAGFSVGSLADFVLLVWGLSLLAHVIRHTFEVKMVTSVMASFVYFIVLSIFIAALLPAPTEQLHEPLSRAHIVQQT